MAPTVGDRSHLLTDDGLPCDLVRQDLYELVYEVRLVKLARVRRVSMDQLLEACRLLVVPIPPIGYWWEKKRGIAMPAPKLPPYSGPQVYRTSSLTPEAVRAIINTPRADYLLSVKDVELLTGRKFVRQQIDQLNLMQIPFALAGSGHPLVPVAAIEGRKTLAAEVVAELNSRINNRIRRAYVKPM